MTIKEILHTHLNSTFSLLKTNLYYGRISNLLITFWYTELDEIEIVQDERVNKMYTVGNIVTQLNNIKLNPDFQSLKVKRKIAEIFKILFLRNYY